MLQVALLLSLGDVRELMGLWRQIFDLIGGSKTQVDIFQLGFYKLNKS
ncbi:hypothetical protein CAL7102_07919 [Dulcicalothrix desertica PCC 7102]|nr:hypothetical protein CAL7102_07919 [Dulcicalothrix desertica PCC 7102]